MVESAVTMFCLHYMNDKVHMTDEDKGQTDQKSFMQTHKNVIHMWQEGPLCKQVSQALGTAMTMKRQLDLIQVY
jgi:hypothetical protein